MVGGGVGITAWLGSRVLVPKSIGGARCSIRVTMDNVKTFSDDSQPYEE